jgi:hypothetical protein
VQSVSVVVPRIPNTPPPALPPPLAELPLTVQLVRVAVPALPPRWRSGAAVRSNGIDLGELQVTRSETPTRVTQFRQSPGGHIDMRAHNKVLCALRPDTPD